MSILTNILYKSIGDGTLSKESLAVTLLNYYGKGANVISDTDLAVFAKSSGSHLQPIIGASPISGDLRFKRLLMRGVRKYPASSIPLEKDNDKEELKQYYSVNFSRNNIPCPSVFLGSNGVGKSSIYAALEKISLQHLFSAEYRGYESLGDQKDYIIHQGVDPSEAQIILETENHDYSCTLDSDAIPPLSFPSFFCMEYDIEQLTKGIKGNYIARQLGLGDFYQLLDTFRQLDEGYVDFKSEYDRSVDEFKKSRLTFGFFRLMESLRDDSQDLHYWAERMTRRVINNDGKVNKRKHLNTLLHNIRFILRKTKNGNRIDFEVFLENLESQYKFSLERIDSILGHGIPTLNDSDIDELIPVATDLLTFFVNNIDENLEEIIDNIFILKDRQFQLSDIFHRQEAKVTEMEKGCPLLGILPNEKEAYEKVKDFLQKSYKDLIRQVVEISRDVFASLFKPYFNKDIADIKIVTSDEGSNIEIKVLAKSPLSGKPLGEIEPRKYLNTFRFKVFCVSLKVSLAITCMRLYNLNFPVVIDDVFDSSDFSNRERIKDFIRHLYEAHHNLMGPSFPLQLIFFTQDDIIGDSVTSGIYNSPTKFAPKYSRIYDYTEARSDDSRPMDILSSVNAYVTTLEDPIKE